MGVAFGAPFGFVLGNGVVWLRVWDIPKVAGFGSFPFRTLLVWLAIAVLSALLATRRAWPHIWGIALAAVLVGVLTSLMLLPDGQGMGATASAVAAFLAACVSLLGQRLRWELEQKKLSLPGLLLLMAMLGAVLPSPVAMLRFVDALPSIRTLHSVDDFARAQGWSDYAFETTSPDSGVVCARVFLSDGTVRECDFVGAPGEPVSASCAVESGDELCIEVWRRIEETHARRR